MGDDNNRNDYTPNFMLVPKTQEQERESPEQTRKINYWRRGLFFACFILGLLIAAMIMFTPTR